MKRTSKTRSAVVGATVVAATLATQQSVSLAQRAPQTSPSTPSKIAELPIAPDEAWNAPGPVVVDGQTFASWADFFNSDFFRRTNKRCATMENEIAGDEGGIAGGGTADCSSSTTNPNGATIYAPAGTKFRIPVVFHVIRNAAGTQGNLTVAQVQANINVMNEDFLARTGTPGAGGVNGQIEFVLTNDYGTTPGTGVLYYNNDSWYNDSGTYYTNSKDVNNYLNLYSNTAGGFLGYDVYLGSSINPPPSAPPADDRVVVLWSAVGDPCPAGGQYCQGRTLTHEVGHYLGLYHSFQSGCGTTTSPGCYTTGDRVCDTNATSTSGGNFGCPTSLNTCGDGVDNVRNYMDYTDDPCMTNFTNEQVRRMRCVLDNRRTLLPFRIPLYAGNFLATPNVLSSGLAVSGTTVCDLDDAQPGMSDGAGDTVGAYAGSPSLTESGDEVAYKINHTGGNLKVTLTGLSSDLDLFILNAAGTPASTLARSTITGVTNEQAIIEAAPAGTYYAVVETFAVSSHSVYGSAYSVRYTKCTADIDNTNVVDVSDLLSVITAWGACPTGCSPRCAADIAPVASGNCAIDVGDLLEVITNWGACPS